MQVIHNEKTEMRKNYSTRFLVAWLHYKYLTVRVVIYLCGSKRVSQEIFAFVNRNLAKLRLKSLFLEASSQRQLLLPCFPTEQFSTPLVLFLGRNRDKAYLNLDSINQCCVPCFTSTRQESDQTGPSCKLSFGWV